MQCKFLCLEQRAREEVNGEPNSKAGVKLSFLLYTNALIAVSPLYSNHIGFHSLMEQIFIEYLFYTRHFSSWDTSVSKTD